MWSEILGSRCRAIVILMVMDPAAGVGGETAVLWLSLLYSLVVFIPQNHRRKASTSITQITSEQEQLGACLKDLLPACLCYLLHTHTFKISSFFGGFECRATLTNLQTHTLRSLHSYVVVTSTLHLCPKPFYLLRSGGVDKRKEEKVWMKNAKNQ